MAKSATKLAEDGVQERILAAARTEFASRGLDASSVRTIARSAGATPAMINYYFRSKRALYEAVVVEAQGRLHERLSAALAAEPTVERLAAAYFDFLVEDGQMQRLLLREVLDGDSERSQQRVAPLRVLLMEHLGGESALQRALSVFGAIAGYFIYAPVLGELLDENPLSAGALARRRAHIIALAKTMGESEL